MTQFYQVTSINHNDTVFVNLDNLVKVEEQNDFVRLYLTSGDIEEVTYESFGGAISNAKIPYMRLNINKPQETFDNLDNSDVEDVTDLSDGMMVQDEDLAMPVTNNQVSEGSETPDEELSQEEMKTLMNLIKSGKLKIS